MGQGGGGHLNGWFGREGWVMAEHCACIAQLAARRFWVQQSDSLLFGLLRHLPSGFFGQLGHKGSEDVVAGRRQRRNKVQSKRFGCVNTYQRSGSRHSEAAQQELTARIFHD